MALKIVNVTDDSNCVDESNQIITRKDLNELLADGWEIASKETVSINGIEVVEHTLSQSRELSVPAPTPPERSHTKEVSIFGANAPTDAAGQLISTLSKVAGSIAGGGSFLGGAVTTHMPGAQIVTSQEVGMARDYGVTAGYTGKPVEDCPFPPHSRPYSLWMDGHKMGVAQREKDEGTHKSVQSIDWDLIKKCAEDPNYEGSAAINELVDAYREGFRISQCFDSDEVVECHLQALAAREAWLKGFKAGGGRIE